MSTLLVIGGTTEARRAASRLKSEGYQVVVSVATGLGEEYAAGHEVISGSRDGEGMAAEALSLKAAAVIDCSHPFALGASSSARGAAATAAVPYIRFTREPGEEDAVELVASWEDAVLRLQRLGERALLTIGVRNLGLFTAAGIDFAARVLPLPDSIGECHRLGLGPEDIIAAFPPHDVDFNRACIRKAGARVLVMKDSGAEGGTPAKVEAAAAEGIRALMVRRPQEEGGIVDIDELVARVREVAGA
ncbi:MAG: precorrin-6A reductase [Gaiellales bacterium]|nr:MAG: precorrin-6A reductase [Gaiellales bacterium]